MLPSQDGGDEKAKIFFSEKTSNLVKKPLI
jgi:hypothetical protein